MCLLVAPYESPRTPDRSPFSSSSSHARPDHAASFLPARGHEWKRPYSGPHHQGIMMRTGVGIGREDGGVVEVKISVATGERPPLPHPRPPHPPLLHPHSEICG